MKEIEFQKPDKCRRCKKVFISGDEVIPIYKPARGRKWVEKRLNHETWQLEIVAERYVFRNHDVFGFTSWYHRRCIPPTIHYSKNLAAANPVLLHLFPSEKSTQDAGPGNQ